MWMTRITMVDRYWHILQAFMSDPETGKVSRIRCVLKKGLRRDLILEVP